MLIRFLTKEESKTVKMIMQFQLPPDKFNEAVLDGTAGQKTAKIMETQNRKQLITQRETGNVEAFILLNWTILRRSRFTQSPSFSISMPRLNFSLS